MRMSRLEGELPDVNVEEISIDFDAQNQTVNHQFRSSTHAIIRKSDMQQPEVELADGENG